MYLFFIGNCRTGISVSDIIPILIFEKFLICVKCVGHSTSSKCGLLRVTKDRCQAALLYNEMAGWLPGYLVNMFSYCASLTLTTSSINYNLFDHVAIVTDSRDKSSYLTVFTEILSLNVTMPEFEFL